MAKYISKLINGEDLYYLKDSEARTNLIDKSEKGAASGVATLDATGKIPSSQIPSDIIESQQSDWDQTDSTAVDYIKNKPTIPTVGNGTLTIQKNGTDVETFTANQSADVTANITVPTKVSELTNDSGYTTNVGTITGITMNGSSKGTSGVVNLGTVITAHQDISGKADKATTLSGYGITDAYTKTEIDTLTRHTRKTDFDLSILKQAVADQNLEKYGLKVGDQKTINGHTYVIAGLNCMKGSYSYTETANHVGLIVIPHTTHAWNASGNTYTGADERGAGYLNSDLHYYLKNTVLQLAQTDLGASNLITHNKLLSNAVNTTGYNRFGQASGCSSSWIWSNEYISALSEMQVYGGTVWSSSGYDTGEADQQLEVFKHYKHTDIFGDEYPWLRDVASATLAAHAHHTGCAHINAASYACYVAGLILFH